jgi:integrase
MATVYKRDSERSVKGSKWIARWFDAESGQWRDKTGYADKEASLELGRRLEREASRRAEGCADPMDEHRKRSIREHLADFIDKAKAGNRAGRYVLQLENRITRVVEGIGATRLQDLDPVRVERFLSELRIKNLPISGVTRNEYVTTMKAFTRWAVEARRIDADPLVSLKRLERRAIKVKHPRRALCPDEIAALLDAAERRPVVELQMIRRGVDKGKLLAKVRANVLERARRKGASRRLAYLLAVWTGLRRSELAALTWGDLNLDVVPARIHLRAETTKSKRADSLVIHPQLDGELRTIRPVRVTADQRILTGVPSMKAMAADLRFAGIDPGTQASGFVDFHSLRKTLSTMMAAAGMSQRARQAHMRHTDPRLTEGTYMDEKLLPIAGELAKLPAIPDLDEAPPAAIPLQATGTDDAGPQQASAPIQQICGSDGQTLTSPVILSDGPCGSNEGGQLSNNTRKIQGVSINRHGPSPSGNGPISKAGEGGRTLDIHVGNVTLYH